MRRRREGEEAIARVVSLLPREGIGRGVWNLDAERFPAHEITDLLGVFFVHPGFELAPPKRRSCQRGCRRGRGNSGRGG